MYVAYAKAPLFFAYSKSRFSLDVSHMLWEKSYSPGVNAAAFIMYYKYFIIEM